MKPMLCKAATPEQVKVFGNDWVLQEKFDGVRAYIEGGELWDRRGKNITKQFPEFDGLRLIDKVVDGEIIAQSGIFEEVSGRVHLRDRFVIELSAKKNPAVFVAFDVVSKSRWDERNAEVQRLPDYHWLRKAEVKGMDEFDDVWKEILHAHKEGVVVKRKDAVYQEGKRSDDWLKVKAFTEVTHTFTKWEGHPRGITIEDDDGRRVVVNGGQADDVIEAFDVHGKVCAEIQYLPQKNSKAWRFPSFRRLINQD